MRSPHWIAVLLLTCAAPVSLRADVPGHLAARSEESVDQLASRLNRDAELARYATYFAASFHGRDLGRQMAAIIERRAASEHIRVPAAMNDSDRRIVHWLESLQGDDFDVAYMTTVGDYRVSCSAIH